MNTNGMLKASWFLALLVLPCTLAQQRIQKLSDASFELGLAVLKAAKNETAVVVPYSIFDLLGMLLEGADGTTKRQLLGKVFASFADRDVDEHRLQLKQTIGNYSETQMNFADIVTARAGPNLKIKMNAILNKRNIAIDEVKINSRDVIQRLNDIVSRLTNNIVMDAFKPGPQDKPLVLTNAVYFKADWKAPFEPLVTRRIPFEVEPGKCKVNGQNPLVTMMFNTMRVPFQKFPYLSNATGIQLPFGKAGETSFYALLPPGNSAMTLDTLMSKINGAVWTRIVNDLANVKKYRVQSEYEDSEEYAPDQVTIRMPAFSVTSSISLKETLKSLGVVDMFSVAKANFAKFQDGTRLYVENVQHKAYLNVNEQGAEGAGVTQADLIDRMGSRYYFIANRPFLYVIADSRTGDAYFVGRYKGPDC